MPNIKTSVRQQFVQAPYSLQLVMQKQLPKILKKLKHHPVNQEVRQTCQLQKLPRFHFKYLSSPCQNNPPLLFSPKFSPSCFSKNILPISYSSPTLTPFITTLISPLMISLPYSLPCQVLSPINSYQRKGSHPKQLIV